MSYDDDVPPKTFREWFLRAPFARVLMLFVMLLAGSCTARSVYCMWAPCGGGLVDPPKQVAPP